jgi:serine/threonine protein kinase
VEPWQIDFGTLKLGKKIAEGYFGEGKDTDLTDNLVYKGTFLQKKVAIKRLKFTQVNDAQEQEKIIHKLKEEAAVMSSLRHPNILLFMGLCSRLP